MKVRKSSESELQDILAGAVKLVDSFEGNAQSFRIVTKLAIRSTDSLAPALDLSRASLRAVLKYPWKRGEQPAGERKDKWNCYDSEALDYDFAMAGLGGTTSPKVANFEAHLMDWADDIAYAVHDVQDYYRAGLIPLDRLRSTDEYEADRFIDAASTWLAAKGFSNANSRDGPCRVVT